MVAKNVEYALPAAQQELIVPLLILTVLLIYAYRWNSKSYTYKMEPDFLTKTSHQDDFIYDMRVMRATRFNFSKRLEKKSKVKNFTVNILSVLSIFISVYLLSNASGISEVGLKRISITIIGLSLLALWMSLDTPSSELSRKAADAHQCGREISEIYRHFKHDIVSMSDAVKSYESVISKYPENHDQLDRAKTLYDDRGKHPDKAKGFTRFNTAWRYYASCYSPACLAFLWCATIISFQVFFPL